MSNLSPLTQQQISQLFQDHRKALSQFLAYRVRCPDTAQDLCQETYLRLLRNGTALHDENLCGLLFRVADRLAINYLKWQQHPKNNGIVLDYDLVYPKHLLRDAGTHFNVRTRAQEIIVSVLEGEAELNNGQSVINEQMTAGSQRSYREAADAGQLTAWVHGQLVFKHTPLREVAAELERYHPIRFVFADPKLAQEKLSGNFDTSDIDPFLHALERILPIRAKRIGQQIRLQRNSKN